MSELKTELTAKLKAMRFPLIPSYYVGQLPTIVATLREESGVWVVKWSVEWKDGKKTKVIECADMDAAIKLYLEKS